MKLYGLLLKNKKLDTFVDGLPIVEGIKTQDHWRIPDGSRWVEVNIVICTPKRVATSAPTEGKKMAKKKVLKKAKK